MLGTGTEAMFVAIDGETYVALGVVSVGQVPADIPSPLGGWAGVRAFWIKLLLASTPWVAFVSVGLLFCWI